MLVIQILITGHLIQLFSGQSLWVILLPCGQSLMAIHLVNGPKCRSTTGRNLPHNRESGSFCNNILSDSNAEAQDSTPGFQTVLSTLWDAAVIQKRVVSITERQYNSINYDIDLKWIKRQCREMNLSNC